MSPNRQKHNAMHRRASDAFTQNDPAWRSSVAPNPWRGIYSGGVKVMQIDARQDVQSILQRRTEDAEWAAALNSLNS